MSDRVCCLYRVSTARQVDFDVLRQADIPVQRKACREFAVKMGWEIISEVQETGVSGFKRSAEERDKLQFIREEAQNGKFDILLVFMFDRIGRKVDESPFVVEWFARHGVRVWSVQEGEQRFEQHVDLLLNYIRFWQADGESRKTSVRTKTALAQMVLEGRFRGGVIPFGYRLEPTGALNKRDRAVNRLVIDEDESQVVRKIFALCIGSGYGRWRIARYLNDNGIKNRSGSWHDATVGAILHNVLYKGIMRSGGTFSEPFPEIRIIEESVFNQVQKLMAERTNEKNAERTIPRNTRGQSLLSGNVFCGHCGGRLTLTTNGNVVKLVSGEEKGVKRIRYVCYNKTRRRLACDGQTGYTMHKLDSMVNALIHEELDKLGVVSEAELMQGAVIQSECALWEKRRAATAEYRSLLEEQELLKYEVLRSLHGESSFSQEVLAGMLRESEERIKRIENLMCSLNAEQVALQAKAKKPTLDLKWSEIYDNSDVAVKKMIAGYLIRRIDVFRDYRLCIDFCELI